MDPQATLAPELLKTAQEQGLLFCIVHAHSEPGVAGFLLALLAEDALHIQEVSVHPTHGGLGLGRALLLHAEEVAGAQGLHSLTLTTFADLPFNAPFYQRLGYLVEETPDARLKTLLQAEAGAGLHNRVAMRKTLPVS